MRLIELMDERGSEVFNLDLDANTEISGITCDSRLVAPGFLFAALPGTDVDGAKFIDDAIKRGASAILASEGAVDAKALGDVQLIQYPNPRKLFAKMAAKFYPEQPDMVACVTGTNGKTSVAFFLEQIWSSLGLKAASLGTLGLYTSNKDMKNINEPGSHTTPDPVKLHRTLGELAGIGVSNIVIEASSHGLEQCRLDGVRIKYGAFTNISRDHLDYHASMESYMDAKLRLFSQLIADDGVAVINVDREEGKQVETACMVRDLKTILVGKQGRDIRIVEVAPEKNGQRIKIEIAGKTFEINLPLVGAFQVENAAIALGLAMAGGLNAVDCVGALEHLKPVPGRMQAVGNGDGNGDEKTVFVDYAHTPDALETV
ncbi:MAG: UDP-N-acetylmuramoyl-L-alanyl-D-glutamate--2,6-diaminopimelate ligase, partial [Sphingomonadales bacterium]|nr:UDP-N-acetylmuramoyl-L-alanyl-D-glutamate--2,6-diaminopimelate ligase [Sphingomonadales bacterium]